MSTWILILTLVSDSRSAAIHSVPGWADQAACMAAAKAWAKQVANNKYTDVHTLCVEQRK